MALPRLNHSLLESRLDPAGRAAAERLRSLPERVLQFGEGAFLRGFADWMIDRMNRQGVFNGRVVVVQPLPQGAVDRLNEQDGLYTLLLRGTENGRAVESREVIQSVSRGINPYTDYPAFLACARNPDLRFVVSNTTEAGIAFEPSDRATDAPPRSFPGKVTAFLHARFQHFGGGGGLWFLPCELIERNGEALKACVVRTAENWGLGAEFIRWVETANRFSNTVVDRIVAGFSVAEAADLRAGLGYEDALLNRGELFHSWVIEGTDEHRAELPLDAAGLNVLWTEDLTPYRDRKVRILNGAHTLIAAPAYLCGCRTIGDVVNDPATFQFLRRAIYDEILPTLDPPEPELARFAATTLERFRNPFIRHDLSSISLNAVSKFRTRVLPSLIAFTRSRGSPPQRLGFSLAALILFYEAAEARDGEEVLRILRRAWGECGDLTLGIPTLARRVLGEQALWGMNLNELPGLTEMVSDRLARMLSVGTKAAISQIA